MHKPVTGFFICGETDHTFIVDSCFNFQATLTFDQTRIKHFARHRCVPTVAVKTAHASVRENSVGKSICVGASVQQLRNALTQVFHLCRGI